MDNGFLRARQSKNTNNDSLSRWMTISIDGDHEAVSYGNQNEEYFMGPNEIGWIIQFNAASSRSLLCGFFGVIFIDGWSVVGTYTHTCARAFRQTKTIMKSMNRNCWWIYYTPFIWVELILRFRFSIVPPLVRRQFRHQFSHPHIQC